MHQILLPGVSLDSELPSRPYHSPATTLSSKWGLGRLARTACSFSLAAASFLAASSTARPAAAAEASKVFLRTRQFRPPNSPCGSLHEHHSFSAMK